MRTLLLVTLLCSLPVGWVATEVRLAEKRRLTYEQLAMDIYTCGGGPTFPWYTTWIDKLRGDEESYDFSFLVFNNEGSVNDETLKSIAIFEHLEQLWLNGDITITDAGLEHLKGLKRLRDLSLTDAPVSAGAVERLRMSLPECDISWNSPKVDARDLPSNAAAHAGHALGGANRATFDQQMQNLQLLLPLLDVSHFAHSLSGAAR